MNFRVQVCFGILFLEIAPPPFFNPGFFFALRFVKEASVLPPDGGAGGPLKDFMYI